MSYDIVYNRQFLRLDGKIIPLVLSGSNNCYDQLPNGRQRRERSWNPIYVRSDKQIAVTEEEFMDTVRSYCDGGEYQEHFVHNGKWVDDAALIRFAQNGIKAAKTIEELQDKYFFSGIHGYFTVWENHKCNTEQHVNIKSSDDLRKFLEEAQGRLDNRKETEEVFICLQYFEEKLQPRVKKERKQKERLTDYYAIKIGNYNNYLVKLTSRRIKYTGLCELTKQFKTEKEAERYKEKLIEKGVKTDLSIEHIVE